MLRHARAAVLGVAAPGKISPAPRVDDKKINLADDNIVAALPSL